MGFSGGVWVVLHTLYVCGFFVAISHAEAALIPSLMNRAASPYLSDVEPIQLTKDFVFRYVFDRRESKPARRVPI
jgi:hypothetical protein